MINNRTPPIGYWCNLDIYTLKKEVSNVAT